MKKLIVFVLLCLPSLVFAQKNINLNMGSTAQPAAAPQPKANG